MNQFSYTFSFNIWFFVLGGGLLAATILGWRHFRLCDDRIRVRRRPKRRVMTLWVIMAVTTVSLWVLLPLESYAGFRELFCRDQEWTTRWAIGAMILAGPLAGWLEMTIFKWSARLCRRHLRAVQKDWYRQAGADIATNIWDGLMRKAQACRMRRQERRAARQARRNRKKNLDLKLFNQAQHKIARRNDNTGRHRLSKAEEQKKVQDTICQFDRQAK